MQHRHLALLAAMALPVSLTAQREIATIYEIGTETSLGKYVCAINDGDGDGTPDFVVYSYATAPAGVRLNLTSGATLATLGVVVGPVGNLGTILSGTDDLDLDGNADFLAGDNTTLKAFSGSNASSLWTSNLNATFVSACGVGDLDNDSRAEVAATVSISGTAYLVFLRGSDGSQLGNATMISNSPRKIVSLGDLNGDGQHEVAIINSGSAFVYRTQNAQLIRTISPPNTSLRDIQAANIVGDARNELMIRNTSFLYAYAPLTGQLLRTQQLQDTDFTVVGDLNGDGFDELAVSDTQDRYGYTPDGSLVILSGATGEYLANWSSTPSFRMQVMTGAGDVDGDGFGDLLLGDQYTSAGGGNGDGAFQLVSGRLLATTFTVPVNCHGSPFPPQLGMSRPIIGQTATVVGRDAPANAWGFVAFSPKPMYPVSLGFSGCNAWFDVNNGILIHQQPPAAGWSIGLPIPNALQLAGLNVALQSFYLPSTSPIGMDLSNGIWARLGAQ